MAKATAWTSTDTEARKRGEQTGLDTLVVHALNDANWMLGATRHSVSKAILWLSHRLSPPTWQPAYVRFTPSDSEQR